MRNYSMKKDGVFSTEEIDKIVHQCVQHISSSAFVKFPGVFTTRRAFMYALCCKDNTNQINLLEFLSGCNRFGLDSPAPSIHKRVSFYGNEEDFDDAIKKQLGLYNVALQDKMHHTQL